MERYEMLVERIARSAKLDLKEVEKRVEEKKAKLSGLISREGAAQIIAAELGISFEDQDVKIKEILPGMKRVNFVGRVVSIFPVREYEKNGRSGKVANFIVADNTGSVRVVLWDMKHIELIENQKIKVDTVVEIKNASSRESEVHLSGFSELNLSKQDIKEVKVTSSVSKVTLEEAKQGQNVSVRGVVAQLFQPRFYSTCPECKKKVVQKEEQFICPEHGSVKPTERAILNFVLDDGTENMRIVLFSEQINALINEKDLKDLEKSSSFRDDFLGTEVYVTGPVKRNQLFNNLEIVANNVEKAKVENLIKELEAN